MCVCVCVCVYYGMYFRPSEENFRSGNKCKIFAK